ncbi:MAG TPA: preprotein translocase subunit SecE [Coriobacteriia bacterium]|jgi:preprotein translocase subunit SecE
MAQQSAKVAKPGVFKRLARYFSDVKAEMRRVVWPSRPEIISSSWIVVITLAIFIVLIGAYDVIAKNIILFLAGVGGQ